MESHAAVIHTIHAQNTIHAINWHLLFLSFPIAISFLICIYRYCRARNLLLITLGFRFFLHYPLTSITTQPIIILSFWVSYNCLLDTDFAQFFSAFLILPFGYNNSTFLDLAKTTTKRKIEPPDYFLVPIIQQKKKSHTHIHK